MAAFSKIKQGDILWDCHRTRMGNTTMSRMGSWQVNVISVDPENRRALCSWNGNRAEWWPERKLARLRRTRAKADR